MTATPTSTATPTPTASALAAFPTTLNLLDNTTRANGTLGQSQTSTGYTYEPSISYQPSGYPIIKLVNNRLIYSGSGMNSFAHINSTTFSADQESQIEMASPPTGSHAIFNFLRIQNPGNANSFSSLYCGMFGNGLVVVGDFVSGFGPTGRAQGTFAAPVPGDKLGCQAQGTTIRAYYYHGGVWTLAASATANVSGAGYMGVEIGGSAPEIQLTNFIGGNMGASQVATPTATPIATPTPTVTSTQTSTLPMSQTSPYEDLLQYRVGFGRNATGGAGGTLMIIEPTESALRAAVESPGKAWVRFSRSGTINLSSNLYVKSNKTIDGRGQQVIISAPNSYGFKIQGENNIIIHNLMFQNFLYDAVNLTQGGNKDIWLDHLSFTNAGDESLDISTCSSGGNCSQAGDMISEVTISWSKFYNDNYAVLFEGRQSDMSPGPGHKVTMHHNYYENINDRAGPNNTASKAHIFNNYSYNWQWDAARSQTGGQTYSENNIFERGPLGGSLALHGQIGGAVQVLGFFRTSGEWLLNGAQILLNGPDNNPNNVFTPDYPYTLETANDALRQKLKTQTGWQADPYPASTVTPTTIPTATPTITVAGTPVINISVPAGTTLPATGNVDVVMTFTTGIPTSVVLARGADTQFAQWPTGNLSQYFTQTSTGITFNLCLECITTSPITLAVTGTYSGGQTASANTMITVGTTSPTPVPDTTLPTVSIFSPSLNSTVSGSIAVSATASDNVGVAGVQFKLDNVNLGSEDTIAPYSFTCNTTTATNASHTLTAVARDVAGNMTTSTGVVVTVSNVVPTPTPTLDTTLPTVSISSPSLNSTVSGSIAVSANASDNVGVAGVQFKLDNVNLGSEDTTAPYSFTWNTTTATNASHTLTAVARDVAGNTKISTGVVVTVSNVASAPTSTSCVQQAINKAGLSSDGGFAWKIYGSFGTPADYSGAPARSTLRVFENSKELGSAHSSHADIRNLGNGRFSHWAGDSLGSGEAIRFSASDNTNPGTNGRTYTYCVGTTSSSSTNLSDVIVTAVTYSQGKFTATVKNQGSVATPSGVYVTASYRVDGVYRSFGRVLGSLAPGASFTLGTQGSSYVIPSGTHTLTSVADDANRFVESNENNNTFSKTITVP